MATVRATLDNSSRHWTNYIWSYIGINDIIVHKKHGYSLYTWDEIIKHDKWNDCWVVIHGKVYDVTDWVPHHPGGQLIYDGAGGDCTAVWESYHSTSLCEKNVSKKFLIGEVRDYKDFYTWDGEFFKTVKSRVEAVIPREKYRDDPQMIRKGIFVMTTYLLCLSMYIYFCTWWSAILYGLCCGQIGVNFTHDGNHMAYTSSKFISRISGHASEMFGLSSVIYRRTHVFGHHSLVNHYELDRAFDSTYPLMRLHVNQPRLPQHKYQQIYTWFLYMKLNFDDLYSTFDEFFWMSNYPSRRGSTSLSAFVMQILVKIWWLFYAILIPSYIHGYANVYPMLIIYMLTFGIGYSLFFAVNHWSFDAGFVDNSNTSKTDWGVLQVESSLNFALDSKFWTWVSGGLNHQIEHHLFPGMVHTRLPEIRKIVQDTCKEFGVKYNQYDSFWSALVAHYKLLKALGEYDNPPSTVLNNPSN